MNVKIVVLSVFQPLRVVCARNTSRVLSVRTVRTDGMVITVTKPALQSAGFAHLPQCVSSVPTDIIALHRHQTVAQPVLSVVTRALVVHIAYLASQTLNMKTMSVKTAWMESIGQNVGDRAPEAAWILYAIVTMEIV